MTVTSYEPQVRGTEEQRKNRELLHQLYNNTPIPTEQMLLNLPLFMRSSLIAKLLHFNEAYKRIINIPGAIMEFGVWWGQNLALFENLRAVYEPYNHARRIIGFDTFEGYPEPSDRDIKSETLTVGGYTVSENYEDYLEKILACHENENVMSQIKKTRLVKGDASATIQKYLEKHPETVVAMACFDMALYEPTRDVLKALKPHLVKGTMLVFDEFYSDEFPGETLAIRETLGTDTYRIERSPFLPDRAYLKID